MRVRQSLSPTCWVLLVIAVVLAVGADHYSNTMHERRVFRDAVYYFASRMEDAHSNLSEPVVAAKKIVSGVSVLKTQNISKFVGERDAEVIYSALNWLYEAAWEMAASVDSLADADREQLRDELETVCEVFAETSPNSGFSEIRVKLTEWATTININEQPGQLGIMNRGPAQTSLIERFSPLGTMALIVLGILLLVWLVSVIA